MIFYLLILHTFSDNEKWEITEDADIVVLTDSNFKHFIDKHEWVLVKFYAPWCGHCKSMAPAYSELALENKYKEDGIPICKLDATKNKQTSELYQVNGYPTLKLFYKGYPIHFPGSREKNDIQKFIDIKRKVVPLKIDKEDEFEELKYANLAAVYYLFDDAPNNLNEFMKFILYFDNIPFAYTTNPKIRDFFGAKENFFFLIIRKFDDGNKFFEKDSAFSGAELISVFKNFKFELVMEFSAEVANRIDEDKKPTLYLFTENKFGSNVEILKKIAPKYKDDFYFVYANFYNEKLKRTVEYLKVANNENVRLIGFKGGKTQKYKVNQVSEEEIVKLLEDYKVNKARQYFNTEPIPTVNNGPVRIIVGANFAQEVIKNEKHVLLEIYAPWCGHCKQFEPIYTNMAAQLSSYTDLVIAKMDGTSNEYPKIEVNEYPTLLFFAKGNKDRSIKYEGEKTLQKVIVFLNRHIGRVHTINQTDAEL